MPDLAGTPLYLAPEIFEGAAASERTDLYSLGVLLYHLVTGSFPVPATTVDELREAQARGAVVRLRDARADLPSSFVRVVDRAIDRDPTRRYPSAGALEADLLQALNETSATADAARAGRVRAVAILRRPPRARWCAGAERSRPHHRDLVDGGAPAGAASRRARSARLRSYRSRTFPAIRRRSYFADGMTDELIATLGRLAG